MNTLPLLAAAVLLAAAAPHRPGPVPGPIPGPDSGPVSGPVSGHGAEPQARQEDRGARESKSDAPAPPPPREKLAGMRSARFVSRISFAHPDAAPHVLETAFAFPERTRMALTREGGRASERVLRYRFGAAVHGVESKMRESVRFSGPPRLEAIRQLELRRAAILWPDGFDWKGAGEERVAALGDAGVLVARLDGESGRPHTITSFRPDLKEDERLEIERWEDHDEREWPAEMRFFALGAEVWTETLLSADARLILADVWFVPVDRRSETGGRPREGRYAADVPARFERRHALDEGLTLEQAAARARALHAKEAERLGANGARLDPTAEVVLNGELAPREVALSLAPGTGPPPKGWTRRPPTPAWVAVVDGPGDVRPGLLEALRLLAGESAPAVLRPRLVIDVGEAHARRMRLVLPLAAREDG